MRNPVHCAFCRGSCASAWWSSRIARAVRAGPASQSVDGIAAAAWTPNSAASSPRSSGARRRSIRRSSWSASSVVLGFLLLGEAAPMPFSFAGNLARALLLTKVSLVEAVVVGSHPGHEAAVCARRTRRAGRGLHRDRRGARSRAIDVSRARRGLAPVRDLLIYIPGLLAWQLAESSNRFGAGGFIRTDAAAMFRVSAGAWVFVPPSPTSFPLISLRPPGEKAKSNRFVGRDRSQCFNASILNQSTFTEIP